MPSHSPKQVRQGRLQSFSDLPDVDQRHDAHATLDPAVLGSVQHEALGSLLLINLLLFHQTADRTAKANADVELHCPQSSRLADDAYTADESHIIWIQS
jgi:hypothetical protein